MIIQKTINLILQFYSAFFKNKVTDKTDLLSLLTFFAIINWATYFFGWLFYVDNFEQPKDWLLFWDTSNLISSGSLEKIYPGVTSNLPFFYPPYFLFLIYPLKYFSKPVAYIMIVAFSIIMLLLAFWIISLIFRLKRLVFLKLCVIIFSSASSIIMLPLGQFSALHLFFICAGLKLRMSKLSWQAGVVLSFLMLKPNIGIFFPFLFLLHRDFRLLSGWALGIGSLLLSSIFIFKFIWWDYIAVSSTIGSILVQIPPWKHHTLFAFLRSIFDSTAQEIVFWIWVSSTVPLIATCLYTWYISKGCDSYYPRLFGIATLVIVVCNPYLYHYDAIILALPAFAWFSNKEKYYFRFSYQLIGVSLFLAYLLQQFSTLYIQRGLSLVSIPLTLCLLVDCFDLISKNPSKSLLQNICS